MKYYLIVGEASGDLHASNLMCAIKELDKNAQFRFFGGDLMAKQGGVLVKHYRELAFMGFLPVIMNLRTILRNLSICKQDIANFHPNAVILVDYPGFNLKIAKFVKTRLSIPVYYYISPKVWAWKTYRIKAMKKYVTHMLSILPFEVDFFKKHDYSAHYVGNPTVDAITQRTHQHETFEEFIRENGLNEKPIIALLAGSRKREIAKNLPSMLQSVSPFKNDFQIIVAGAPGIDADFYAAHIGMENVMVLFGQTYRVLSQATAAAVTSGTATLETALLNVPQVVCYKMDFPRLSHWAFHHILHTPYISLVNLVCGNEVVKELFAKFFNVTAIREEMKRLLFNEPYRQTMFDNYRIMRDRLGTPGASRKAAEIILKTLHCEKE